MLNDAPIVVALTDSPAWRETLAILLEPDCAVRFASAAHIDSDALRGADVVVVESGGLQHDVVVHASERAPIVIIGAARPPAQWSGRRSCNVPADPAAIRAAVQQHLPPIREATLRAAVTRIAGTLQRELHYPMAALRHLADTRATRGGTVVLPMLSAVLAEQCIVIDEHLRQAQRFAARPHLVRVGTEFVDALCRELQSAGVASGRSFSCRYDILSDAATLCGPAALVPFIVGCLLLHVRRRAAAQALNLSVTSAGIRIAYPPRRGALAEVQSWPLLLIDLVLQPFAWRVDSRRSPVDETIHLIAPGAGDIT